MPKVLQFICPTGYYGAERWIIALLNSLNHSEVESHLCITLEGDSATDILEHCNTEHVTVHQLPMSSKFDVSVIGKLVNTIKKHNIDIIHTHGYKSDILGVIAGKKAGIKTVCTPHGFENASDLKLKTYMWLGGKSFHFFDVVCPLSPQIKADLIDIYHVNDEKIQLINNGVDLNEVIEATANTQANPEKPFTIGYIGQLISRKNLSSLFDAFALFLAEQPTAELKILGDGEERAALEALAKTLGIQSNVEFLGFRDDRLAFLANFDTFALTSSLEGIPRCLMEAMAAKTCVTAYDIPGVDQLVKNNETGLCVPFNDEKALAASWQTLASSPETKKRLALAGEKWVHTNYSSDAMAVQYTALFQQLTQNKAASHA